MALEYGWSFEGEEREPVYVFPVQQGKRKLLGIENVTLSDGSKIEVHIAPLTVDDDEFVQSLASESGHASNVSMICHLCVKWGDKDFVLEEDIKDELDAVGDVGAAIASAFPKRAAIIKGRKKPANAALSAQREQLQQLQQLETTGSV